MVSYLSSFFYSNKTQETHSDNVKKEVDQSLTIIPYTSPTTGKDEQAVVLAPRSLKGRAQPIQTKEILKTLLNQIKQSPEQAAELLISLKSAQTEHTESHTEFEEVINMIAADRQVAEARIDEIDAIENEWLDECVLVDNNLAAVKPPPGYEKTWISYGVATGGTVWYVTKVSGSVLYFVCDKVVLNGRILQLAAAAGGVASLINAVGNPCLPVLQTVVIFLFRRLIP